MTGNAARLSASRLGLWVAPAAAAVSAVSLTVAVSTPVRSGPWCADGCVAYPYTDAAAFVPRDYLWIYPQVLLVLLVVLLAVCLRHWVPPGRRLSAAVAECFAVIGAAVLVIDYGTQLTVLQPAFLTGQTEGLSVLSQYNPHGVFIALENVGYALFGAAFVFLGGALAGGSSRPERAVRWVFTVGGALILAALVLSAAIYRAELDYRFEVISLSITWLVLIVSGTMLTVVFGRALKIATQHPPAVTADALAGR
jgi:hypothetical protein